MNIKRIISVALLVISFFLTAKSQTPTCIKPLVTTHPSAGDYGSFGQFAVMRQTIAHPDATVPAPISVFLPSNATTTNRVPVIFFTHGNMSHDYLLFAGLLNQLASNGYIVVFGTSLSSPTITHPERYQQFWSGFQLAVKQYGNVMDTTKVGFAGHSIGGGAVPEMATRGVAQGWGANGLFLMPMAAWYSWGTDYSTIPATAKLVVQVYWDDPTNEHLISQNDVWNRLPQIVERRWQVIRAASTRCQLAAGHGVPLARAGNENALDHWGVWRRLHALSDYTFTGNPAAGPVAFGDNSYMGQWRFSGIVALVTPMEASSVPVNNTTGSPQFRWLDRCDHALGLPCIPPSDF